jgi:hypothetical protein
MAMLVSAFAPAKADPLPDDYLGLWCFEFNTYGLELYSVDGDDGK